MLNTSKTTIKKSVELASDRPEPGSRIRRQPVPSEAGERRTLAGRIRWDSREWEGRVAAAGIIFFALAICAVVVDLGELLGR